MDPQIPHPFFQTCVNWPPRLMAAKEWLDEKSREISRDEFLGLINPKQLARIERGLGYDRNLHMKDDYHVRYFKDSLSSIAYFVHSATEHVFARESDIVALNEHALRACDPDIQPPDQTRRDLVIDRLEALAGLEPNDPDYEGDLQDEAIDAALAHQGRLLLLIGSEDLSPWLQTIHRRLLENPALTPDSGLIWVGVTSPPEGRAWLPHATQIPEYARHFGPCTRPDHPNPA